jgi:hypothetical protein
MLPGSALYEQTQAQEEALRQQAYQNLGINPLDVNRSNPVNYAMSSQQLQREIDRLRFQAENQDKIDQGYGMELAQGGEQDFSAIDAEIAQLEQELAGMPQITQGQQYQAPGVPELPGAEMFQNPLLRAIQDDVTNRLFANRAARGKLGSGGTALALQDALAPTALNLGLTQQTRQLGQQQQNIDNLFRLFGMGANVAAGQGSAGIGASSGIGNALLAGGTAQAGGALGQGQAISQGLGGLSQIAGYGFGGGFSPQQQFTGELGGYGGFRPTIQGSTAAGPLTSSGSFFG